MRCPSRAHYAAAPWHFLNFLPLPQGQGSLRPTPAYGFAANAGSVTPPGAPRCSDGGGGSAAVTRPSAAGFDATIGVSRRRAPGSPPAGPVTPRLGGRWAPWPGGGPISICSLSHRSANVV